MRVDSIADERVAGLRVSGWPVSAAAEAPVERKRRCGCASRRRAFAQASLAKARRPVSPVSKTPVLSALIQVSRMPSVPVAVGEWHVITVELSSSGSEPGSPPRGGEVAVGQGQGQPGSLVWPDGVITDTLLSTYLPGLDTRPPGEIKGPRTGDLSPLWRRNEALDYQKRWSGGRRRSCALRVQFGREYDDDNQREFGRCQRSCSGACRADHGRLEPVDHSRVPDARRRFPRGEPQHHRRHSRNTTRASTTRR